MKLFARSCDCLIVALFLTVSANSLAADTADECRARCGQLAEADHRVCSDLPPNPSCANVVEANRKQCFEFCGRTNLQTSDEPEPQGGGPKADKCDAETQSCH
jgi:hypothetical protein